MRCHKFHHCAEILWLNCCALGLKIYQYKKRRSLVSCNYAHQARNGSSEIPVSLRLWSPLACVMTGWKHIPTRQHKLCCSDDWSCWQAHIVTWAKYPHFLLFSLSPFLSEFGQQTCRCQETKVCQAWHEPGSFPWCQQHRVHLHEHSGWLAVVLGSLSDCLGKRLCFNYSKSYF